MTERRTFPRHPIILPTLCVRSDGTQFHAVTVDLSAEGLKLRSATPPEAGEALICHIRSIGAVSVRVALVGICDFVVTVTSRTPAPGDVARRLIEISRQQAQQATVPRVSPRIVPAQTVVQVTLADGIRVPAEIINLSASGVALRISTSFFLGEAIMVGRQRATIARQNDHGVGAAFVKPFADGAVGEHTVL